MMAKRLFDIFFSGIGLVLLTPLYLIVAIAIRIDSPGPILFRQIRVGRRGAPFTIHKFRTMRAIQHENAPQITVGADPRITRTGTFLRKFKIDEIPQLFDVFIGKMSLVGPRPEVPQYIKYYPSDLKDIIFSVRPGITDLSSIIFLNESDILKESNDPEKFYIEQILPTKLNRQREYVENVSLMSDLKIIATTLLHIIKK